MTVNDRLRRDLMKKKKYISIALCSMALAAANVFPAYAAIKNLEINADVDNISGWEPGVPFFPELEVEDEDSDLISFRAYDEDLRNADPTRGFVLRFSIEAEDEILSDDLKIRGRGIRASYVDSVSSDNMSASGRLLVYPFYQLRSPAPVLDISSGKIYWDEVPYAGSYEVVVTYISENGNERTAHFKTSDCESDISDYIKKGKGGIGIAVRALPTKKDSRIEAEGLYADMDGQKIRLTSEAKYYNIASSDFGDAENSTLKADISDYETDDVWALLGDYEAVTDGNFASYNEPLRAYGTNDGNAASGPGGTAGTWKRVTYKWQYVVSGTPYSSGWLKLGNSWYYFDEDGFMHTGWLMDNGNWYYLESRVGEDTGVMYTGTRVIDGENYTFDESGACLNKE